MFRIGTIAAAAGFVPAALGAVPGAALVHPAAKISATALQLAVTRHYGPADNASGYSVVLAFGKHSSWVFGGTNPGGESRPVAARWNGSKLTPSALPAGLTGFISDAAASSAHDIWASSEWGRYVVRWNGQRWSVVRRWRHGTITGLTVAGSRSVWVFSTTAAGFRQNGTWHFNGRSWTHASGLAGQVFRASAISRRDIWGVAAEGRSDIVVRFNGRAWRRVHSGRVLSGVTAHDILAISDRNVWVVGNESSKSGYARLILLHWNGASWTRVVTSLNAWAGRVTTDWRGDALITATPESAAAATGLILRATPRGQISLTTIRSALDSGVSDIAVAKGTRNLLVAGGVLTHLGGDAAIWAGKLAPAARPDADND